MFSYQRNQRRPFSSTFLCISYTFDCQMRVCRTLLLILFFKSKQAYFNTHFQILDQKCSEETASLFVNFVLFTRDRTLTNETQLNCFISLSYSLIYIRCVKSYSAKFVRNHSLIRYFLHFDWLLPSTDLKGSFKVALIM